MSLDGLYTAQRRPLLALAWMMLGSTADAEDAVQECFSRADRAGITGMEHPAAYLRTMVKNECLETIRQRRRTTVSAEIPPGVHLDPPVTEFVDALVPLSPRRRTAIVLRYYLDLPVNEIAHHMGCRPSTVSSLIHRALNDLKEVLHEQSH